MEAQASGTSGSRHKATEDRDAVVIRFAGDSGDGMQLTGTEFTRASALYGNDLATFPDYPAEIRAPAGTLAGVSGFQLNFSSREVFTPGDQPDVLVAMNAAALKTNVGDLPSGGMLIVNTDGFNDINLQKAGYKQNPLNDSALLSKYQVVKIDITKQVQLTLQDSGLSAKEIAKCKNFWALGLMMWLYNRPLENEERAIREKFKKMPDVAEGNVKALNAGWSFGETTELFTSSYKVAPANIEKGTYRNIEGNEATAIGLVTAAQLTGLKLFYGSYPITPASNILHYLSTYRGYDVITFQAEDEIAAVTSAIGASFAGAIGVTGTSGPGVALKGEAIGLAVMTELPLVIVDVQRGGPSTGLPTKTEQADLLQAAFGRNSDSPACVIAPLTPSDCFWMALEAVRIATKHMCPVLYLSDGYLANGAEPWRIPALNELPKLNVEFRTDKQGFFPYLRNTETLARPWAIPGTPGLEHRIGGIEKEDITGNISYDPANHERMVRLRQEKIDRIANDIPLAQVEGDEEGDLLLVGWGGTSGALTAATKLLRGRGHKVGHLQLRYICPLQKNVEQILKSYSKVLVCELNMGQLRMVLRSRFLVDAVGYNKIQGKPFKVTEVVAAAERVLAGETNLFGARVEARAVTAGMTMSGGEG
jgi:2-oxoglutarate ferredoxin oxidoreductase subunit alpha